MQAHYSTGAVASSFTSTAQVPVTQQEAGMKTPALNNYNDCILFRFGLFCVKIMLHDSSLVFPQCLTGPVSLFLIFS